MRYITVLLLLAGCAGPSDLLEQGHRFTFTGVGSPRDVAHCIARNAERHPFTRSTVPTIRDGETAGSYEVIVNVPLLATTDAMAIILAAPGGAAITIYALGPRDFYERRAIEYVEGCAAESPRRPRETYQFPEQRPRGTHER
jgi:hypothetical protein